MRVVIEENTVNHRHQFMPHIFKQERSREVVRPPVLVLSQDQDTDQVVQQVRQENLVKKITLQPWSK